jgi:hypothetical protein
VLVAVSLVLCVLHLPESRPGLVANAVVLALLIAGGVWGWLDRPRDRNSSEAPPQTLRLRLAGTHFLTTPRRRGDGLDRKLDSNGPSFSGQDL